MTGLTTAAERLTVPDAVLSRTDLRTLGWQRRAIDQIFQSLPVICLPGYARPFVRVSDYLSLIENSTFRGDRVR